MAARWLIPAAFRTRRGVVRATYEHPALVRITHWLAAIALVVMAASGLQILRAFPAFGPKIPERDLVAVPGALALGGWLAGGLQWHFTFMWIFAGAGALYLLTQAITGRYRMVLFRPRDVPGVWPMARHYFLFGPRPPLTEPYNPLQKLAYTTTILCGALSVLTGLVLYKPVQFSPIAFVFGGYRITRVWHFAAMCGLLAFVPGHVLMVVLHGWNNFVAMLTGWNRRPEYLERSEEEGAGMEDNAQPGAASPEPVMASVEPGGQAGGPTGATEQAAASDMTSENEPHHETDAEGDGNGDA